MPKYNVESNIKNNGKTYEAGDTIELDESIAGSLLKDGIISESKPQDEAKKEDEGTSGDNSDEKAEDGQEDENSGKEADEEAGDDKEGNKDGEGGAEDDKGSDSEGNQDQTKEYKEMSQGELITYLKAREIIYEGANREAMIELLERSDRVREANQEENQGEAKKEDEDNGNDL